MTIRGFLSDLIGVVLIVLACAWSGFDAANHAGRVSMTTLAGALALAALGGWLISKTKTLAALDFLFTQAKRLVGLKLPIDSAGSDTPE